VWDSGSGANGNGGTTTANFLAGMVKSLPPLHDVAAMAGLDLPKFLGDATVLSKLDGNGMLPPPK
jgi:flotillin